MSYCSHVLKALVILNIINASLASQTRELSVDFNPNCTVPTCHSPTDKNMVHIKASGPNDTVHYIWSTIQQPTLLIARTTLDSNLLVDWSNCCGSLETMLDFSSIPLYLFQTSLDQLIEFSDPDDTGKFSNDNYTTAWNLTSVHWEDGNSSIHVTDDFIASDFNFNNVSINGSSANGSISITLRVFNSEGLTPRLPNLPHTDTSAQVVVNLEHLPTSTEKDRLAIALSMGCSGNSSTHITHSTTSSMDDEYSPGVFKDIIFKDTDRGFVHWKPAAYLSEDHAATKTTNVELYLPESNCDSHPAWGLEILHCPFNVSFGMPQDGFYAKSNYTSWTLVTGVGPVPDSKMSLLAYVILSVGLGVPTVLFVAAIIYIIVHRWRSHTKLDEKALVDPSASQ